MLSQLGHITLYIGLDYQSAGGGRYTFTSDLELVVHCAKGCEVSLVCECPAGIDEEDSIMERASRKRALCPRYWLQPRNITSSGDLFPHRQTKNLKPEISEQETRFAIGRIENCRSPIANRQSTIGNRKSQIDNDPMARWPDSPPGPPTAT